LASDTGRLNERAVRGGLWLLALDAIGKCASLLKLLILGRLLSADDFGAAGVALLAVYWAEYVSETGLSSALIQRPGNVKPFLDVVFTVQLLRGLALGLALWAGAPLLGAWVGSGQVVPAIRVVALLVVVRGATSPAVACLHRELAFRKLTAARLGGIAAGLVTAVGVALVRADVWALLASVLVAQCVDTALSYWITRHRPRLSLDLARARELMSFGKWVFGANVVSVVGLHLDGVVVARALGIASLGLYQMAQQLIVAPLVHVANHVHGVLFSTFSSIQGERDRLRRALLACLAVVGGTAIPVACLVSLFAAPLVGLMVGPKWQGMAGAAAVLAWVGVSEAVCAVTSPLLKARGRPDLVMRGLTVKAVLVAVLVVPLVRTAGLEGAALSVLTGALAWMFYQLTVAARLVEAPVRDVLAAFAPAAVGSTAMVLCRLADGLVAPPTVMAVAACALAGHLFWMVVITWPRVIQRELVASAEA
jgi:O-antigen/teichoic acid export membrane protein